MKKLLNKLNRYFDHRKDYGAVRHFSFFTAQAKFLLAIGYPAERNTNFST